MDQPCYTIQMIYKNICIGEFVSRPNRFIANVLVDGRQETVHVKNTGRCRELLLPGAKVVLTDCGGPQRKTRYDLIAVYTPHQLINIDSQAPNPVARDYLADLYPEALSIRSEYRHGDSRLDFLAELPTGPLFVEVKGVTLLEGRVARFPDAPTTRGVKHLNHLADCARAGDTAMILFILQMQGADHLEPNDRMDPAFGQALRRAAEAGVQLRAVDCTVEPDRLLYRNSVPVILP